MASRVVTIIIGNEQIKICEVSYSSQKVVHVYASATVPTPLGSVDDGMISDVLLVAKTIKETVDEYHITSKNVIFSLQSGKIANKEIIAPLMKASRLSSFIATNATEYFPVNIDEYVLTYSILEDFLEEELKKQRIMVTAAPVALVDPYYQLANILGFHMESMDYVGNSALQLMRLQFNGIPTIIIQMGEDSTVVTILNNNVLQIMRSVPYGRSAVAVALSEQEQLTYEEAVEELSTREVLKDNFSSRDLVTDSLKYLSNNISRVMDYYTTKNPMYPIEKAYMITEGREILGIEKLFSNELEIQVDKIQVLNHVVAAPEPNMTLSNLTLYLANIGAIINPVNFIPREAAEKVKKEATGKYFRLTFLVAVFVSVLLVFLPGVSYISNSAKKKSLEEDISRIQHAQETVNAFYQAKDMLSDLQAFQSLTSNPDDQLLEFIEFLQEQMPSDISITSLSVVSGSVTMSCVGSSKETLAAFIKVLKSNELITGVYVAAVSENEDSSGAITVGYSIICNYNSLGTTDSGTETTEEGN